MRFFRPWAMPTAMRAIWQAQPALQDQIFNTLRVIGLCGVRKETPCLLEIDI